LLAAACGPSWPQTATAVEVPQAPRGGARSIDILPADLQLWTDEDVPASPLDLRSSAEAALMSTALDAVVHTGRSANVLDWTGSSNGRPVMDPRALDATEASLSGYGAMVEMSPHSLPIPYLPARLGTVTNADATLYVGGWAFVGKHETPVGVKIAEGVLIAVAVVAVVVVIAAMSKGGGGGHGGGGGGHGGGGHGGGGGGGARLGTGGHGGGAGLGNPGNVSFNGSQRQGTPLSKGTGRVSYARPPGAADDVADIGDVVDSAADAFGHVVTIPVRPDYVMTGQETGKSAMYLEMTLVDNHTGLPIWHASQTFPASADRQKEVRRAARTLLKSMPH
jgi:hypothetical protein